MKTTWELSFEKVCNTALMYIGGQGDITNSYRAQLATILIEAFGNDTRASFLLIAPNIPNHNYAPPDAVLFHPETGIIIFKMRQLGVEDIQRNQQEELIRKSKNKITETNFTQEDGDIRIDADAAIRKTRALTKDDKMPINSFIVFPEISINEWEDHQLNDDLLDTNVLFSDDIQTAFGLKARITHLLNKRQIPSLSSSQIYKILKIFGDNAVFSEEKDHRDIPDKSLGKSIDEAHTKQKQLSKEQQELSRLDVYGAPRLIRGVAGSGKSIVLANQIARYLTRSQQKNLFDNSSKSRIAVICFNRSLVPMLRRKIELAYTQNTGEELDPDRILISHFNNLFYHLKDIDYLGIKKYKDSDERALLYLEQIRDLKQNNPSKYENLLFDALFIDEGQDFSPEEYEILTELVRVQPETKEKSIIIFYDDAQNLYARVRPNWKQIGINVSGGRSYVMKKCFRNTRQTVEVAFNVLIGKKAPTSSKSRTFADVNYLKQNELVDEDDNHIHIKFASRQGNPPVVKRFSSRTEEKKWVVDKVVGIIRDDHVRPEDLLILFHRKRDYEDLVELFRKADIDNLIEDYIQPYGGSEDKDVYIFQPNHLTISTTYGAKGYDSMLVFLIGVDQFNDEPEDRASFYVGATRAILGLYLTGLDQNNILLSEAQLAIQDLEMQN